MKVAVNALFWAFFLLTAPLVVSGALLLWAAAAPFDPTRAAVHAFLCRVAFGYGYLNPWWDLKVEGRERIPKGAAVLVANHQTMGDIVAVMGLYRPFKFVSKASMFAVPIVGWVMALARYVRLDRGRPHSTRKMFEACRAWLRAGVPVLMFPEGTYRPLGDLLPFRAGAFRLAIEEQVPVVPVVIEGTRSLVSGDGPWLSPRCRVRVRVQAPLPPEALGTDDAALAARVRALFLSELGAELAAERATSGG